VTQKDVEVAALTGVNPHPKQLLVFVLGLLGVVGVLIAAPFAWTMGSRAREEIEIQPGRYGRSRLLTAGWVLGIIGTCMLGLGIVAVIVALALGVGTTGSVHGIGALLPSWMLKPQDLPQKFIVMFLAILLFALVMGLVLAVVDKPHLPKWVPVAGYLGPSLLLITFGLLWPGLLTIKSSFFDRLGETFVGLANYQTIFTDSGFLVVLRNTVFWVALVPTVATALGLVYAVLVDRTRVEKLAKTLIFLPMAISMVGASIIWKFMYDMKPGKDQIGLLNQVVVWMGGQPQPWLLNPPTNSFMMIIVMIWIQAGFAMTVLSAAIKAIPDEIIEAAKVDGVTGVKLFWWVTVPSVRPAIIVVLTTIAMGTLKSFDIVYTMTGGNFDSSIVAQEFYTQSFNQGRPDIGAALAVLLFVMIVPIIIYNVRQMRISEGER